MTTETRPMSVVVPTVGRPGLLQACLASLASCVPRADELLVVDQSGDSSVREVVAGFASVGARYIACSGRGVSRGRNVGIAEAAHDLVLVTDDDCTVAADWVSAAWELARRHAGTIITGSVLPAGDPSAVPSWKDDPNAHDFTGEVHGGALFPNNMVLPRSSVLAAGGFDERFGPDEAAEDNDFSYRWLRSGGSLRYEPSLVVWHHDWRTRAELERLYTRYARGQGFFYAKHLRRGDWTMLRFLARDLYWAVRSLVAAAVRRRDDWADPRRGILRGLPQGLVHGWRVYWARGSRHAVQTERDA